MSKTGATLIGVIAVVTFLHAFRAMQASNITGNISSNNGSVWVYAINGKDSLKTMVSSSGKFRLTVKPGSWKVLIANSNMLRNEGMTVEVPEGGTMDVGTIKFN